MAERTLRERCIDKLVPFMDFDGAIPPEEVVSAKAYNAGLAFDAILGVLTEHADEWISGTVELEPLLYISEQQAQALLAVLGGGVR